MSASKPRASFCAYIKALNHEIDWVKVFSSDTVHFIRTAASLLGSKTDLVAGCLLLGTSTVLSGKAYIVRANGQKIPLAIYLVLSSLKSTGKTPAYNAIIDDGLRYIEKKFNRPLLIQFSTVAGMRSALQSQKGCGGMIIDELGLAIDRHLSSKDTDNAEFRAFLNNLFSGSGLTKTTKTQGTTVIESSYFTFGGTAQPIQFCNLMRRLLSNHGDGCADRFLSLSSPIVSETCPDNFIAAEPTWPRSLFEEIYSLHKDSELPYNFKISPQNFETFLFQVCFII